MLTDHEHLHKQLATHKKQLLIVLAVMGVLLVGLLYVVSFVLPKKVDFSYAGVTCTPQLTLLPGVMRTKTDDFTVSYERAVSVGSVQLASLETCLKAKKAPAEGVNYVATAPWGGIVAQKTYALQIAAPPVANMTVFDKPLPTAKPLSIGLTTTDVTYGYTLTVADKEAGCSAREQAIVCDVASLKLEQNKGYTLALQREWQGEKVATLASREVKTLPATKLQDAAIKNKQTIYSRVKSFDFTFDKDIATAAVTLEKVTDTTKTPVDTEVKFTGKTLTVTIGDELARDQQYVFAITAFEAKDGSTLEKPYKANFKMSGGPKLSSSNIGKTGAGLSQTVVLTFDQPILDNQDISKLVTVSGVSASVSKEGRSIYFRYSDAPKCKDFSITIAKGLQSNYKVEQTAAQTLSSRTVCYTTETIGYSREGRPIRAYFFGNGSRTVLFTGAIHGSEPSSYATMSSWISELDVNARQIPSGQQVVVVPMVSPDGYYSYGRFNAKKVNLNRNWPTSNWEKDGGAGGSAPLSEPETKALAALTNRLQPRFVATYHAQGRIVNSNDIGSSVSLGSRYAATVGYRFVTDAQTVEVFGENITGTYEDWLKARGTPCVLMELDSLGGDYFWGHKGAMWMLVKSF